VQDLAALGGREGNPMNTAAAPSWRATQGGSALIAALVMAIGMGFGRFAFTGVYPAMVSDGVLSIHNGTLAATANYAGYLIGALSLARLRAADAHRACLWSVIASVLCMAGLGFTDMPWLIIAIRGLAGVFSALSMVAASLWLLQHRGHPGGAPMLFAGVGVGIVISSELLAAGAALGFHSAGMWGLLAIGAAVMGLVAASGLGASPAIEAASGAQEQSLSPPSLGAARLIALYGLSGFGYVVTATYLPLLIKSSAGSVDPIQVWAVFGLGAAPSCFFWHALHQKLGSRRALFINLVAQAVGVILPVLIGTAWGYLGSALIVGGTFAGTVTIAMPAARRLAHTMRFNMLAAMTAAYGVGQIVGPLVASALYAGSHSFSSSLMAAGAALGVAALICVKQEGNEKALSS
jgi:hypothetical protein